METKEMGWTVTSEVFLIQYVDPDDELMMLPSDIALLEDANFKKYVELYAGDKDAFFRDFAIAFAKMLELGVNRPKI